MEEAKHIHHSNRPPNTSKTTHSGPTDDVMWGPFMFPELVEHTCQSIYFGSRGTFGGYLTPSRVVGALD